MAVCVGIRSLCRPRRRVVLSCRPEVCVTGVAEWLGSAKGGSSDGETFIMTFKLCAHASFVVLMHLLVCQFAWASFVLSTARRASCPPGVYVFERRGMAW